MKKLKLKAFELGAKEVLTRSQLKGILGGSGGNGIVCIQTINASCGGGTSEYQCIGTLSNCQDAGDEICAPNDCCDNITCYN